MNRILFFLMSKIFLNRILPFLLFFLFGSLFGYLLSQLSSQLDQNIRIITFIIGTLVTLSLTIWKEYILTSDKLSVEIYSIDRKCEENINVNVREYSEFDLLFEFESIVDEIFEIYQPKSTLKSFQISLTDLESKFVRLKIIYKNLSTYSIEIEKILKYLNEIDQTTFRYIDFASKIVSPFDRMNINADNLAEKMQFYDRTQLFSNNTIDKEKYKIIKEYVEETFNQIKISYNNFNSQQQDLITKKIQEIKDKYFADNSKFYVSLLLTNSGRLNTSIKTPVLLRIYISNSQEYVNLQLEVIESMRQESDVSSISRKFFVLESKKVLYLSQEDKKFINKNWENSVVNCVVFLEDLQNNIYKSPSVTFASELTQKRNFNKLINEADKYYLNGPLA